MAMPQFYEDICNHCEYMSFNRRFVNSWCQIAELSDDKGAVVKFDSGLDMLLFALHPNHSARPTNHLPLLLTNSNETKQYYIIIL